MGDNPVPETPQEFLERLERNREKRPLVEDLPPGKQDLFARVFSKALCTSSSSSELGSKRKESE